MVVMPQVQSRQGLAGLPWVPEMHSFDQPGLVVTWAEWFVSISQFFQGFEVVHPEKPLLGGAEDALHTLVALRVAHESR